MSTIGVLRDVSGFFLSVGLVGAGIAVICALIAAVALARAAAGLCGGAVAVWIGGALLSLAAGFVGQWLPALASAVALVAALVLGALARAALRALPQRPEREPASSREPTPVRPRRVERLGGEVLRVESIR